MHPFYAPAPPRSHQPIPQPQPMYHTPPYAMSHAQVVLPNSSSHDFDVKIERGRAEGNSKLQDAISRSRFLNSHAKMQCSQSVQYLCVHRNLYMYTYEHLVHCCRRNPSRLLEQLEHWKRWDSIKQLTHQKQIRLTLSQFLAYDRCQPHRHLLTATVVIHSDDNDLLYHLLYCGRKHEEEFYRLTEGTSKESDEVIDLIWKFVKADPPADIASRLRAHVYRMSRKSAHVPSPLNIKPSDLQNVSDFVAFGAYAGIKRGEHKGQEVAIKTMRVTRGKEQEARKMFASEAILWSTLRHPNIVGLIGISLPGPTRPEIDLIMPFFRNGNIRVYLHKCVSADRLSLSCDVAQGLEYIHSQDPPIYHGDLKCDNVFVDDTGHACIGDFGLSYASDSRKYLDSSRVGLARGPPYWAAPELFLGDTVKITDMSDIYAFGCILYEMISGQVPLAEVPREQLSQKIVMGTRPERPASVSSNDPLWMAAKACWQGDPNRRPDATTLIRALTPLLPGHN